MVRKIKKHIRQVLYPIIKIKSSEKLHSQNNSIPLNSALNDRISFSVLRNNKNKVREIENISYEININDKWEWIVRYDDHGGEGSLHRHYRASLKDDKTIESAAGMKKCKDKNEELTWVCKDIKRNYLMFRSVFLRNCGLDLY